MHDEWDEVKGTLTSAGIAGAEDFGRFVSNGEYFAPSRFDEKGAMPVLLSILPGLTDPRVVATVAGHLRRPWARPTAFGPLRDAFRVWAPVDALAAGWHLGDAVASASTQQHADELIVLCLDRRYGKARQMVVGSLWRFAKSPHVTPALLELVHDGDVGLHAMSALRRVLGPAQALPYIEAVERDARGTQLGDNAARAAWRIRKKLAI